MCVCSSYRVEIGPWTQTLLNILPSVEDLHSTFEISNLPSSSNTTLLPCFIMNYAFRGLTKALVIKYSRWVFPSPPGMSAFWITLHHNAPAGNIYLIVQYTSSRRRWWVFEGERPAKIEGKAHPFRFFKKWGRLPWDYLRYNLIYLLSTYTIFELANQYNYMYVISVTLVYE